MERYKKWNSECFINLLPSNSPLFLRETLFPFLLVAAIFKHSKKI